MPDVKPYALSGEVKVPYQRHVLVLFSQAHLGAWKLLYEKDLHNYKYGTAAQKYFEKRQN